MEGKARLLSPFLVMALLVSLVASIAVVVNNTPRVEAVGPVLEVTIRTPEDGSQIDVCQPFLVDAIVTNTGLAVATNVTAYINFDTDLVEWKSGDSPAYPHTQQLGDLEEGCSVEVMWTLHCKNAGSTSITVWADCDETSPVNEMVNVNQLLKVDITVPEIDCAGYEVCPSQTFTVRATITNTGVDPVTLYDDGAVQLSVCSASIVSGPSPTLDDVTLDAAESRTVSWTLHCESREDDTITVMVYDESDNLIGYDEYAFHQRGLMVDIVMPTYDQTFCVGQDFYVNAVVTNTCGDEITDVSATLEIVSGSAYLLDDAEKDLGTLAGKLSRDVFWELHCNGAGPVTITVTADGTTAFGQDVEDVDSVEVLQNIGLTVIIEEPPFTLPDGTIRPGLPCLQPDQTYQVGFSVCPDDTFVVKAIICNLGCGQTAYNVSVTLGIDGNAVPVSGDSLTKYVGDIAPGAEVGVCGGNCVCVSWTLRCTGPGSVYMTVNASGNNMAGSASFTVCQAEEEPGLAVEAQIVNSDAKDKLYDELTADDIIDQICACNLEENPEYLYCCNNVFYVKAKVTNPGCAPAKGVFAELLWTCGAGSVSVDPSTVTQSLGDLAGQESTTVTWEVTCTGAGSVCFWVGAWAGNVDVDHNGHIDGYDYVVSDSDPSTPGTIPIHKGDPVLSYWDDGYDPVCIDQKDFIVTVQTSLVDPDGDGCLNVSTCQEFTVTARFFNCAEQQSEVNAIIDYADVGAQLVAGSTVDLEFYDDTGTLKYTQTTAAADAVSLQHPICHCCYVDVTWTLECVMAVDGDITVRAETAGGIFLGEDSVCIDQQWKAHLVAGLEAFPGWVSNSTLVTTATNTFTVGQGFTVVATVTNIGQATACNVNVEINVTGNVNPSGLLTMAMADGMAGFVGDSCILGGESAKVWWELTCTDIGAVSVEIPDGGLTGIDVNTGVDILPDNIDVRCALVLQQVKGEITVVIIQPYTCCTIAVSQEFCVKALITNGGAADLVDVSARINIVPDWGASVISGESYTKYLTDALPPARTIEVGWTLHCDAPGDVTITVTAIVSEPGFEVTSDPVVVHQQGPSTLEVTIMSPVEDYALIKGNEVQMYTYIATSQEFAVTAWVYNPSVAKAVNVVASIDTETDGPLGTWYGSPALVAGETADKSLGDIASGDGEMVTWTLHCDYPGWSYIEVSADADNVVMVAYDEIYLQQYPAAHLVVDIAAPADSSGYTVGQNFVVTATVTNTGWADAWEVSATLSIDPAGSAQLNSGGYTQSLGTLAGWGQEQSKTVSWNLSCKEACNSTIMVTAAGNDEFGFGVNYQWTWYDGNLDIDNAQISGNISGNASVSGYISGSYGAYFDGYFSGNSTGDWSGDISGCWNGDITGNFTGWMDDYFCGDVYAWVNGIWYDGPYCGHIQNSYIDGWLNGYASGDITDMCWCNGWNYAAYVDGYFDGWQDGWFCGNTTGWFLGNKQGYFDGTIGANTAVQFQGTVTGKIWFSGYLETLTYTVDPGAPIPAKFIESASITVKQMEPAALLIANISYPTSVDVGQDFTVDAIVVNPSSATAEDVVATLHISANLDASAVGSLTVALGDIAGGDFELVSWVVHCDGAGSGAIAVSADGSNTTPAVAGNGSVIQIAVPVPKPCLTVTVDAPAQVSVEQSYYVTTVVSNPCDAEACDVVAVIAWSGNAELASGSASHTIGCIAAGSQATWSWEMDCTDVGGVNITVTASGTGTNTAVGSVAVGQVSSADIVGALNALKDQITGVRGDIASGVATIDTDLGEVQTSLASIGATVVSIDGNVATIKTNLQTLEGTVTDISDGVATIVTDVGTIKADVSQIAKDTNSMKSKSNYWLPILILVAIGAIAVIVGVAIAVSRKRPVPVVIERKGEE
jgi:hypothetical protein